VYCFKPITMKKEITEKDFDLRVNAEIDKLVDAAS
jgi:hypothetical protein